MKKLRQITGDKRVWFRDYRRGFITTRLREKAQIKDVMQATGQKDIKTVLRYYQPAPEAKRKMVEAASRDLESSNCGKSEDKKITPISDATTPRERNIGRPDRGHDEVNGTELTPAA
jgi:hypothetical protein